MPDIQNISSINVNGHLFDIKDAYIREVVHAILETTVENNNVISTRLNNLNERVFDALLTVQDNDWSPANSIVSGVYKIAHKTSDTITEYSILFNEQGATTQLNIRNDNIYYRNKTNDTWGDWNVLTPELSLSNDYAPSTLTNDDLYLEAGDTYEEAFSKIEKSINDNEIVVSTALNELDTRINNINVPTKTSELTNDSGFITEAPVTSVNGMTGAVTVNVPVTSVNGMTGAVAVNIPVTSVNGMTGAVTISETQLSKGTATGTGNAVTDINVSNHQITLVKGATYATQSDIDTSIANLVDSAPETLNTLNELAAALGNDENFATTVATQIGEKYTKPSTGIPASDLANGVIPDVPVQSVNGQTGAVTINVGVTSFNGSTGAVTYTAPVISVNGATGAVTIKANVQSDWNATSGDAVILNKPDLTTYANKVTSVNGMTGAVTIVHPVTSVNGQTGAVTLTIPDAVTESTVAGWGFTKNTGTLTTETQLSKGTATGTGNAVTDINVSNHQITLVKGATYATQEDINESISNLVNSAPATLDTLNELATALGNDPNFATTVATQIGEKYTKPSTGIPASDLAAGVIPTVPVQSVNGQTGAVTINVGVTSFNGSTGAVTYTAPVTSVNGQTGAVTVKANVQSDWNATTGDAVILNKPTIPTVNDSTVTLTMNGNTVGTFTLNKSGNTTIDLGTVLTSHQSIKTVNNESLLGTGNVNISGLPTVTSADNGKVLMVVNGAWQLVSPVSLYSGSSAPSNSQGNNGDIYVQS